MERIDYVIDIQAFHNKDGSFSPKEIAIIGLEYNFVSQWIVKPECGYDELPKGVISTNSYLSCFQHGIEWYDGESLLEDVYASLRVIVRNAQNIYVRGYQKEKLLERVLGRQIVNLEDYSCPSFKYLPKTGHFCAYHSRKTEDFACASSYAHRLRAWLRKALDKESSCDGKKTEKSNNEKISVFVSPQEGDHSPTSPQKSGDRPGIIAIPPASNNEFTPDSTSTPIHTRPNSRSLCVRQDSAGVDEAGCYYI